MGLSIVPSSWLDNSGMLLDPQMNYMLAAFYSGAAVSSLLTPIPLDEAGFAISALTQIGIAKTKVEVNEMVQQEIQLRTPIFYRYFDSGCYYYC